MENPRTFGEILRKHWPEFAIEAWGLGTFMVLAGAVTTLMEYPGSPIRLAIENGTVRRALIGCAMGLTAIGIIYSPWGKQSGAHLNPAVTLTFYRLGKIRGWDAALYMAAQFIGGIIGVMLVWAVLGQAFAQPPVHYVTTKPGPAGVALAFTSEVAMSFGIMSMVLALMQHPRSMRFIGLFAGAFIAVYITVFGPISGMSMNPARTFASALPAQLWSHLWLYFTAPIIGMLLAVDVRRLFKAGHERFCAKLNHDPHFRCIHCGHQPTPKSAVSNNPFSARRAQGGIKTHERGF
jgi:aquaporin Z